MTRPFSRRSPFSPSSLFASGEQGALIEAPTLDTLYTDDAGTTQATTGDPAAVWSDGSGNGNDATQTELANRMVVSGSGPYYLDPDGVNDNFSIPLGAGFTGDFCLILDTGPIFGSIDTGTNATWNYTVNPAYIPDGKIHALIVVDRALTSAEKQGLADYYTSAVTTRPSTAEGAFRDRTDLTALDASYGDWTQVTSARFAFFNCSSLTTPPDVSGWTQVTSAASAFRDCSSLTTPPDVSGWTQVTNAAAAFFNCSSLTTPPNVSGWTQVTSAMFAFFNCSSLTSAINLDNWNPTILTNGVNMMSGISAAGFDQTAYDSALTAWDAAYDLTTVNTLNIHFGSAQYGSGAPATARGILDANGWTITDGGPA